jgi:hypothetical protein
LQNAPKDGRDILNVLLLCLFGRPVCRGSNLAVAEVA